MAILEEVEAEIFVLLAFNSLDFCSTATIFTVMNSLVTSFFYFNVPGGEGKGECEKIPHASGKPAARWLPSRTRDNGHGRFPDRWSISLPSR